jgi:hypothetical protein
MSCMGQKVLFLKGLLDLRQNINLFGVIVDSKIQLEA